MGDVRTIRAGVGMIVTVARVKVQEPFTTFGEVTDVLTDGRGVVAAICVLGKRLETNTLVHAWFAICPEACGHTGNGCALAGSLVSAQKITLGVCGHSVRYGCGCDVITAGAPAV